MTDKVGFGDRISRADGRAFSFWSEATFDPLFYFCNDGGMGAPIDMVGQRCGRLVVTRLVPRPKSAKHTRLMWECRCDCGNTKVVVGKLLRNGMTKSCGCLSPEVTRGNRRKIAGHSGMVLVWHAYKAGAQKRNLSFGLDLEEFRVLSSAACWYCGNPPTGVHWARNRKMTQEGVEHSKYVHNGVDRIDSSKGYSVENCVPCCSVCNYAKRDLSAQAFIAWARQLVAFQDQRKGL